MSWTSAPGIDGADADVGVSVGSQQGIGGGRRSKDSELGDGPGELTGARRVTSGGQKGGIGGSDGGDTGAEKPPAPVLAER